MRHSFLEPFDADSGGRPGRRNEAAAIVARLARRWEHGEATDDAEVIADHSDLLPELAEELHNARIIRHALVESRKALGGEVLAPAHMKILSDAELYAPIDVSDEAHEVEGLCEPPKVPGCLVLSKIDAGGQAMVYRAVQESTGRVVAAKVMRGGVLGDSHQRARFEREAGILASLRHPHLVYVLDRGRTPDGDFYLLMEYVDGCDLDAWWAHHVPEDEAGTRRLIELFVKVCRAVEVAHARRIVHRDLKPSNVRVDTCGEPRVLDFGLARPIASTAVARPVTVSGQLLGSIPWSSPEQAAGKAGELDARSDVYSLGVMLFQGLTGRFPYPVAEAPLNEVLDNIVRKVPSPPSRLRSCRPLAHKSLVDAVVLRALAKAADARYTSAGELANDLERAAAGQPISPVRQTGGIRPLLVALVVAAVAGVAVGWSLLRRESPPPVFDLPSLTNTVDMRLVRVPGGVFLMGSPASEPGRDPSERQRYVTVSDFYMATHEVTQAQFERVMGRSPQTQRWRGGDLPVHSVSWVDAIAFCDRLSAAEHRRYRLPTEAEWEYACRAGSRSAYFGDRSAVGWFKENSGGALHPAGQKWPNGWGLFDMHGNVAEWCADAVNPSIDGQHRLGDKPRVYRGGGAFSVAPEGRAAARPFRWPDSVVPDIGFRVVLDPER